jgi:hypothetical protein
MSSVEAMPDVIKVSKVINAPKKFVFEWCTDFRDDDPKITGSSSTRKVVEKTKTRAIYVVRYRGSDGLPKTNVNIVAMKPYSSWHLDQYGEEDNETGDYKLTNLGKKKTRIDMIFKENWKKIAKVPSIEEQISSTNRVWDKFVASLEKEFGEEDSA